MKSIIVFILWISCWYFCKPYINYLLFSWWIQVDQQDFPHFSKLLLNCWHLTNYSVYHSSSGYRFCSTCYRRKWNALGWKQLSRFSHTFSISHSSFFVLLNSEVLLLEFALHFIKPQMFLKLSFLFRFHWFALPHFLVGGCALNMSLFYISSILLIN